MNPETSSTEEETLTSAATVFKDRSKIDGKRSYHSYEKVLDFYTVDSGHLIVVGEDGRRLGIHASGEWDSIVRDPDKS